MSMVLTLRRVDPIVIESLSGDAAVAFCIGFEDEKFIKSDDMIDFFSSWHIVHFLSSGTELDETLPAGFMIGGKYWAQAHPDEEPFRILNSQEVKAAFQHLEGLTQALITERLEILSKGTFEIYKGRLACEEFDEAKRDLEQIKHFFGVAAARGFSITKAMG